jgi:phenylacetate-CoA ligase
MPEPRFWNERIEATPRAELAGLQQHKLRRQLEYLVHASPFYRDKLAAAGVAAEDVRTLADLQRIPFTEKEELRESLNAAPPLGLHRAADDVDVIRIHTSSGTTGDPTYIGITAHDQATWMEILSRVMWSQGLRPSKVAAIGLRMGFFVGGLPLQQSIEAVGSTCVPVGTGESYRLVESMRNLRATHLFCTPSYAGYLTDFTRETFGIEPRELGLERIHVGGEPGGSIPTVRAALEQDWGAMVTEGLGNTDLVPIYCGECEAQEGMHFLAPDYLALELIDPETGAVLDLDRPDDELTGELVMTHLDRECSPVLRFRTRDHVRVWTAPCSCGRTGIRLRCIGRTDDLLIVRGVNVWPGAIKDVVMSLRPRTTGQLQILLDQPGPRVEPPLRIQIEMDAGVNGDEDALRKELEHEIRRRLIFSPAIELVPAGSLPRTELKSKLVRNLFEEAQ